MSYDHKRIADLVNVRLQAAPLTTLGAIALELSLGRHTISRALRVHFGSSFRALQREHLDRKIRDVLQESDPRSIKQSAQAIGYCSATALARASRRTFGASPSKIRRS